MLLAQITSRWSHAAGGRHSYGASTLKLSSGIGERDMRLSVRPQSAARSSSSMDLRGTAVVDDDHSELLEGSGHDASSRAEPHLV